MCTLLFPLNDRESKPIPEFFWLPFPVPDWAEARLLLVLLSGLLYLCIIRENKVILKLSKDFFSWQNKWTVDVLARSTFNYDKSNNNNFIYAPIKLNVKKYKNTNNKLKKRFHTIRKRSKFPSPVWSPIGGSFSDLKICVLGDAMIAVHRSKTWIVLKRDFKGYFNHRGKIKKLPKTFSFLRKRTRFFCFQTYVIHFRVEKICSIVKIDFQLIWSTLNVYISAVLDRSWNGFVE